MVMVMPVSDPVGDWHCFLRPTSSRDVDEQTSARRVSDLVAWLSEDDVLMLGCSAGLLLMRWLREKGQGRRAERKTASPVRSLFLSGPS